MQKLHRHFIGLPLLVLAVVVSASGRGMLSSLLQAAHHVSPVAIHIEEGNMTAEDGVPVFLDGTAIVRGAGLFRARVGDAELSGFEGAFHITGDPSAFIVSALTTPVSVQISDHTVLIPLGYQWSYQSELHDFDGDFEAWYTPRSIRALPQHFIQRQFTALQSLQPVVDLPSMVEDVPEAFSTSSLLFFPAQEERLRAQWNEDILGSLRYHVAHGDVDGVESLLLNTVYTDVWQTPRAQSVLSALALQSEGSVRMALLQPLLMEDDAWLLASVHPDVHAAAWSFERLSIPREFLLVRLFAYPFADTLHEGFSVFAWNRYEDHLASAIRDIGVPSDFVSQLLVVHTPLVTLLEERGYPERARALRAFLLQLADGHKGLSSDAEAALRLLRHFDDISIDPLPEEDVSEKEVSQQEPETIIPAAEREQRAFALLHEAGALFTVQSVVTAAEYNTVKVRDILFASQTAGDRFVSFVLDLTTGLVSDIELDDQRFPYDPPFEDFVVWMKR